MKELCRDKHGKPIYVGDLVEAPILGKIIGSFVGYAERMERDKLVISNTPDVKWRVRMVRYVNPRKYVLSKEGQG